MIKFKNLHPVIWMVATSFTLVQFFLQLSSGVIIGLIMNELQITAFAAGLLSGSFYIIYTALQIPVGILCDRKNLRPILSSTAVICAVGCLIFSASHQLPGLYLGRLLIAFGSAFSFVSLTHLVREYYPRHLFGALIGGSETLSFIATVFGIIGLGSIIHQSGWRDFMHIAAIIICFIAYLCWRFIPNKVDTPVGLMPFQHQLMSVLKHIPLWCNGLFLGLTFMLVTVFGGLWAPPFMQIKLGCSLAQASWIDAIFILGVGISCPLFGYFSQKVTSRKRLIMLACICTATMLTLIIYLPIHSLTLMSIMMLCLGLISGSYIIGYTFANELSPPHALSTTAGMTNTLALVTTPIFQPFIGYMIDTLHPDSLIMLADYQQALMILPVSVVLAAGLVYLLPST